MPALRNRVAWPCHLTAKVIDAIAERLAALARGR
jgi:hypothetical protein